MTDVVFLAPVKATKDHWLLNNGNIFPTITFGVTHIEGFENIYNAVNLALQCGYRAFDCSPRLNGELYLGAALEQLLPLHNLQRSDIMISSKILPQDYGPHGTHEAVLRSCQNLKTDYIDLFLMQWPGGHRLEPESEQNKTLREDTWKEMVRLSSEGVIKSAGVCHFNSKHLESILKCSNSIPAVNQVEFHPRCPQIELLEYCAEHKIQLQAASQRETFNPLLLKDTFVKSVASSLDKSPAQVLLRWILNKGVGVISESEKANRIKRNIELYDFPLDKFDMDLIASVAIRERYLRNSFPIA